MIRLSIYMVCFFFSLWTTGQYTSIQNIKGIGNNKGMNNSTFHEGASKVLESNMDPRGLRSSYCISCHDGVLVKASHSTTNFGNPENMDMSPIFSFNHPVAFEFTSSLALSKNYLKNPYSTPSGLGGTIAEDLLVEGRIECVTCHNIFFNPENKEKYKVLNKSNESAALCLTCHNI